MKRSMSVGLGVALALLLASANLVLDSGAGKYGSAGWLDAVFVIVILASFSVGWLVATRRPSNPIGWLLLASGAILTMEGLASSWAGYALNRGDPYPGARLAANFDSHSWPLLFAPIVAIAYLFPDGKLASPRFRIPARIGLVGGVLLLIGGFTSTETLDKPFDQVAPYGGLPSAVSGTMLGIGLLSLFVAFVFGMVSLVKRFRGSEGELRAQMKWISYAAFLIPLAIICGTIDPDTSGGGGPVTLIPFVAVLIAIPAAVGIAVLRYRLYEIDRLINATLVYAILTASLAGAFIGVTLLAGVAVGGGSPVATAAATLAVALTFRPLRDRIQAQVDRRFNPSRYEGLRSVDSFLADLRDGRADPEGIGPVLAGAARDPALSLYFRLPDEPGHTDAAGQVVDRLPAQPPGRTPVRRADLELATVVHTEGSGSDQALLDAVILRAGLAIEIARLRVEVRRRLAEVERSRARIVSATYEERRRLERDLHDGAQQRLVSLGLDLRHVQHRLAPGDEAGAELDGVVNGLTEAIDELRELARGVRPAALDDGLAPALRELAARSPLPTEVESTDERFVPEVEAAAYFVASEALTNAVKHSGGTAATVRASRDNGSLRLVVTDDGKGGAGPAGGSGLTGLSDRVAALGGRLELKSPPGDGTELTAEFPCE